MQIVTICTAVKIQEQQLGPCSALRGSHRARTSHRAGTSHPVSSPGSSGPGHKPIPATRRPCRGQRKAFAELGVFSEPRCRGCAWHRHAAGQVEVLPRECQELFLGKPWLLLSGMGGKEPLT